jgi:hypothetical protein
MTERPTPYAGYDVMAKRDSVSFDDVTRRVLDRRLGAPPKRRFFSPEAYGVLEACCARLIPQGGDAQIIPIAPWIDADVADNRGEGFREPGQPILQETWRRLLAGIEAEARARFNMGFAALSSSDQDVMLQAMQDGAIPSERFGGLDGRKLFIGVLAKTAAEVFYSHPVAWNEIGYGGPAAPRGYVRLGLNERDPWEASLAPAPGDGL